jgi:transposase-like protein
MTPKYTIKDFNQQFATDADCLAFIYRQRHPEGATCEKCGKKGHFHPVAGRRSYACMCGEQIYPTQGTIYHKSPTSLRSWFFAMFLMTASKNGVSAKELERQLGVTYKCAWRMAHQIRQLLNETGEPLTGVVEMDETFVGGKPRKGGPPAVRGRGTKKIPVVGMVERKGHVVAKVASRLTVKDLNALIRENVAPDSTLMTDDYCGYRRAHGFVKRHSIIKHSEHSYVVGEIHTNTIEGFWSQLKRSINGTFHSVSRKHLQKYVNEFAYRYNRRKSETAMFLHVAASVAAQHAPAV